MKKDPQPKSPAPPDRDITMDEFKTARKESKKKLRNLLDNRQIRVLHIRTV